MNDEFLFAEEDEEESPKHSKSWKILIVDDEPELHAVTKLALSDFSLNGIGLTFISAYSGQEAIEQFKTHPDIAVVLLDVVMETDDAGLKVANRVRNELGNQFTRIILRTGQPGQAPEKHVIVNYDINDYKSKTELTAQRLFTVVIAAIRSYRDIMAIEENRVGLAKVVTASKDLFGCRSLETFFEGLIQQLSSVLGCTQSAIFVTRELSEISAKTSDNLSDYYVFAANGIYKHFYGKPVKNVLSEVQLKTCNRVLSTKDIGLYDDHIVSHCNGSHIGGSLLFLSNSHRALNESNLQLIQLFSDSIQIAFENIVLLRDARLTQNELIERLCRAMDFSAPTDNHIPRLVTICAVLAKHMGMDEQSIDRFKTAVPMHDVGNYRLPESLLKRDGPLNREEKREIQQHTFIGAAFLANSDNPTVKLASELAKQHHEKWDGTGYPNRLKEKDILLESRILTAADVFDALYNKRKYKEAWPIERVLTFFDSQKGKSFDPRIVELITSLQDELVSLQHSMKDGISLFSHSFFKKMAPTDTN